MANTFVMFICFLFLFLTETSNSSSVTCDDEGDFVITVDVTVIGDDNDDNGKLCATAILFVVAGDVTVIAFDENDVVKFFAVEVFGLLVTALGSQFRSPMF